MRRGCQYFPAIKVSDKEVLNGFLGTKSCKGQLGSGTNRSINFKGVTNFANFASNILIYFDYLKTSQ
jgi:hypothetical protein